ncbi:MAG: histidine phosphatase family protein, partial [Thiohalobacterales bacterium]|nr:histidine phosphatase family protein [Thiohalobacterales bacterium]
MAHELLLLRHGKSDWDAVTDDFHRPLKDRGKRAAQRMGVWLAQQQLLPDLVISSPAERALATAQKLCKAMGPGDADIRRDERIYEATAGELLEVLAGCPDSARRVLLVGHNPGLEDLLTWLAGEAVEVPPDGKLLPTATLARLTLPGAWNELAPGCATLEAIVRPAELPKKFPFPGPDGTERRDRPAYYYTQSSVIPYRLHKGRPEILVIASSRKNHLVVPKGIKDPGLGLRESAAKEAWEEAGVEGEVGDTPLGEYRYSKWGATCSVTVYPMKVTRMVPKKEWEESHR